MGEAQVARPSIFGPPPTKTICKPSKPPFQKAPAAQIEDRRRKGLCFYCDEKWVARHKYKTPKFFLMEEVQASMPEVEVCSEEIQVEECIGSEVSSDLINSTTEIILYAFVLLLSNGIRVTMMKSVNVRVTGF